MESGSSFGTYVVYAVLGVFLVVLLFVLLRLSVMIGMLWIAPLRDVADWLRRVARRR